MKRRNNIPTMFKKRKKKKNVEERHLSGDGRKKNVERLLTLECCVCSRSNVDSPLVPIPNPIDRSKALPLSQIHSDWFPDNIIPYNAIFISCCQNQHAICGQCLHDTATNYDSHPVNETCAMIPCMAFDEECVNENGFLYYFNHEDIEKLLDFEEKTVYREHVSRYRFPGYEIIRCPRSGTNNIQCCAEILISRDFIRTSSRGHVLLDCSQRCNKKSCYYCYRRVYRTQCTYCVRTTEWMDPYATNHYFYRIDDSNELFYRNSELTPEIIIQQLYEIVDASSGYVRCFACRTKLYKTEQCNALSHCRIEICYACGRSGTRTEQLGNEHWDRMGLTGCPRFDHHNFWNEVAECDFQCVEGDCYDHELGECTNPEHQTGIHNMIEVRKKARIYHALFSLLAETLEILKPIMETDRKLQGYIPPANVWQGRERSDYREYLPNFEQ